MSVNLFDADYYRSLYPDLVAAGLDTEPELFNHFQSNGLDENREFSPLVSLSFYALDNPDLAQAGLTTNRQLYDHLANFGVAERRRFSPFVDLEHYQDGYADIFKLTGEEAFTHLKNFGISEKRRFSPYTNLNLYQKIYSDIDALSPQEALVHLVQFGVAEKRQFSGNFDIEFYQRNYPDLNQLNLKQAFEHLVSLGVEESRSLLPKGINDARSLGDISTPKTITNWVGYGNTSDYYSFNLPKDGLVNLNISGTSGGASLILWGANREILRSESSIEPKDFSVPYLLKAGTYYVEVYGSSAGPVVIGPEGPQQQETTYTLDLSTTPQSIPANEPGATFSDAKNLGNLRAPQTLSNSFNKIDQTDYYSFTLNEASEVQVDINQSEGDVEAALFKGPSEKISQFKLASEKTAKESVLLDAGTYYLEITGAQFFTPTANYKLNISTTPKTIPIDRAGDTIDTATDLGVLTDRRDITDWAGYFDQNDYYKFTLNAADEVSLSLEELTTDLGDIGPNLSVSLFNQYGKIYIPDMRFDRTSISVDNFLLQPGVYHLQVNSFTPASGNYNYPGDTNYNLSLFV